MSERVARCRRCNGDDPNRVVGCVTGLCRECERSIMEHSSITDSLVAAMLNSIDRILAAKPTGDMRLVEIPPRHLMTTGVSAAWTNREHEPKERDRELTRPAPAGVTAGGSFLTPEECMEKPVLSSPFRWVDCEPQIGSFRPIRTSAETPTQSLARIRDDIAAGRLAPAEARKALIQMVYMQHDLKHGPGGSGRLGPCDADCVKCAAEEEIERMSLPSGYMPQAGDYVRIDWMGGSDAHHWVEGEVQRVHRPRADLVAEVRVDRSDWLAVGSVQNIGIEHGAKVSRIGPLAVDSLSAASEVRREALERWFTDAARPDGFSQAKIDEIKATMLARRGAR